ncbi:MAG: GFA family protein [Candidatus Binatia bacterium]
MEPDAISGGCLCGAIRYVVRGRPSMSMICHCASCRRAGGAPAVAWVTFAQADMTFVRGTPASFQSSAPATRTFCASCGTPLTYLHAARPTEIDVTTATLDAPHAFPPTHHAWVAEGIPWARPTDGLPADPHDSGAGRAP